MADADAGRGALAGCGVAVTRPAHQADGLVALLSAAGATALRFPTVEIVPRAAPAPAGRFDWAVFVSSNAVTHGGGAHALAPRRAALGPATAAALGGAEAVAPDGSGSEGLLADARFAPRAGERVLIVRGVGGRELLADALRARGVEVVLHEVYARRLPQADPAALLAAWREGALHAVTATSGETLRNLATLLGTEGRSLLAEVQLVVVNARMVETARMLGARTPPLVADGAADAALVAALCRWWGGRSAAATREPDGR